MDDAPSGPIHEGVVPHVMPSSRSRVLVHMLCHSFLALVILYCRLTDISFTWGCSKYAIQHSKTATVLPCCELLMHLSEGSQRALQNAQVYQELCKKHTTFRERSENTDLAVWHSLLPAPPPDQLADISRPPSAYLKACNINILQRRAGHMIQELERHYTYYMSAGGGVTAALEGFQT